VVVGYGRELIIGMVTDAIVSRARNIWLIYMCTRYCMETIRKGFYWIIIAELETVATLRTSVP